MRTPAVLPSRSAASRLLGKRLSSLVAAMPLLRWFRAPLSGATGRNDVVAATDDERSGSAVRERGLA